ncbi:hypothetical protein [Metamycoplasma alkalescens]|uniref:NERD domain-containing protein n=3 Tax=Metamycoplasma alkalescens TaxID=45363 RepID=N9SQL2_9BACT|nr:hypothetical protein [Metamycoplasma alkalescens]ENY53659.1 Hypothetical protein MALK_6010 [Metamycoplasma alkalescens 14918]PYF43114.1 hypothetical protein BCF88_10538 [Metamycoplasma alkalescens]
MDSQIILILTIAYSFFLVVLIIDILVIVKKIINQKKKSKNQDLNLVENITPNLSQQVDKINKLIPNTYLLNNITSLSTNDYSFDSGKILVNNYGLFVLKEFNDQAMILEGNFNEREWFLHTDNQQYSINNLFWALNKNIENLIPLLPKNLPILGILICKFVKEFKLSNFQGHLLYTNISNLPDLMYQIKSQLQPTLSNENVNQIIDLLNNNNAKTSKI